MKYKSSVLYFFWFLHSSEAVTAPRAASHSTLQHVAVYPGPGHTVTASRAGVNLTHLWFETSDLKCFTELWSHNAPIPANKCFSQRPITERRGAGCKAGRGARAGKTPVVSAFYGLLSVWMRSDARYDPGPGWEERHGDKYEQLMGVTTLHSQARPDRKPGWGW